LNLINFPYGDIIQQHKPNPKQVEMISDLSTANQCLEIKVYLQINE